MRCSVGSHTREVVEIPPLMDRLSIMLAIVTVNKLFICWIRRNERRIRTRAKQWWTLIVDQEWEEEKIQSAFFWYFFDSYRISFEDNQIVAVSIFHLQKDAKSFDAADEMRKGSAFWFLPSLIYQMQEHLDGNNSASGALLGPSHVCLHVYLSSLLYLFEMSSDADENASDACYLIIQQHLWVQEPINYQQGDGKQVNSDSQGNLVFGYLRWYRIHSASSLLLLSSASLWLILLLLPVCASQQELLLFPFHSSTAREIQK